MRISGFWPVLLVTAELACGAKTADGGGNGTDSNTHWLARCGTDSDCRDGMSCECGACTRECTSAGTCDSLAEGALCLPVQCDDEPALVCSLGCDGEADCPSGTDCEGGACVPRLATPVGGPAPDAGPTAVPDAGPTAVPDAEPPPDSCPAQDARSSGNDCESLDGWAFDGSECAPINCGCVGTECDEVSASLGDCQRRFLGCLELPMCTDETFSVVDDDPALSPAYPEFVFEVVGTPELVDEESGEVAIFAEWTRAEWLGSMDLVEDPPLCIGAGGEPTFCPEPYPFLRELSLEVDGEFVYLHAVLPWAQVLLPPENTGVDVRIERHPQGTLSFGMRDPNTMLPLLMIVQRADALELEDGWEFFPFTFRPGFTVCRSDVTDCGWVFLAQSLYVEADGALHSAVLPGGTAVVPATPAPGTTSAQVVHSAFHVQAFESGEVCAAVVPARQSFAFSAEPVVP